MFVITVIPLRHATQLTTLTYYARVAYTYGTLVTVPIRKQSVQAIVVGCEPVSALKTNLRSANFSLRKLPPQDDTPQLPQSLLDLTTELHRLFPVTKGALLTSLLPKEICEGCLMPPTKEVARGDQDTTPQLLQKTKTERFVVYKSHIRSVFARGGSVLLITPTDADITAAYQTLATGIAEHVIELRSRQTKQHRIRALQKLQTLEHPVLIITTPSYAYTERAGIQSIIIEQASSEQYVQRRRPYIDHRVALRLLARLTGRSLILGDILPRTEWEWEVRNETMYTYDEPLKRLIFPAKLTVVAQTERPTPEKPFEIFAEKTVQRIQTALKQRRNVFLYAARRGLAPIIACFDCGEIMRCPQSGAPYSLIQTNRAGVVKRWFVASTSGIRVPAFDTCPNCHSWRLKERGIGIQHIEKVCPDIFPDTPLITFDTTKITSAKTLRDIKHQMNTAKGALILGTQAILPHLPDSIEVSCVTSLEAARSIPTWRADEVLLRLLFQLRDSSAKEVLVQTRSEPDDILALAGRGSIEQFYTEQFSLRKTIHYPPFTTFIHLTWNGNAKAVEEQEHNLIQRLQPYTLHIYSPPQQPASTQVRYGLLRIAHQEWPDDHLLEKLRFLPPNVRIMVNPDRIV